MKIKKIISDINRESKLLSKIEKNELRGLGWSFINYMLVR